MVTSILRADVNGASGGGSRAVKIKSFCQACDQLREINHLILACFQMFFGGTEDMFSLL